MKKINNEQFQEAKTLSDVALVVICGSGDSEDLNQETNTILKFDGLGLD